MWCSRQGTRHFHSLGLAKSPRPSFFPSSSSSSSSFTSSSSPFSSSSFLTSTRSSFFHFLPLLRRSLAFQSFLPSHFFQAISYLAPFPSASFLPFVWVGVECTLPPFPLLYIVFLLLSFTFRHFSYSCLCSQLLSTSLYIW